MSRSRKKQPFLKDERKPGTKRYFKRQASKKVRRYIKRYLDDTPSKGYWFRKVYDTWDINDYVSFCPSWSWWAKDDPLDWFKTVIRK